MQNATAKHSHTLFSQEQCRKFK